METSFRYTGFQEYYHFDRSWEIKINIVEESKRIPEISLGLRDAVGTGVLVSEYIVSNKKFGNIDLSLGLGWGRMSCCGNSFKNPFSIISPEFNKRGGYGMSAGGGFKI